MKFEKSKPTLNFKTKTHLQFLLVGFRYSIKY